MDSGSKDGGMKVDARVILAVLWVAEKLCSLNGDTYRLSDPVALKSLIANTGPIVVSTELLSLFSIILMGSIFMSVLTLTLKYSVSRWANRIIGIFYALVDLGFLILGFTVQNALYEKVWATGQVVFAALIVWYAWKLPKQEA